MDEKDDELRRTIVGLLASQQALSGGYHQTSSGLKKTNESLKRTNEALMQTNEALRRTNEAVADLSVALGETNESLGETIVRVDNLAELSETHEARLSELIDALGGMAERRAVSEKWRQGAEDRFQELEERVSRLEEAS